ncbi:MAG: hypothetical protein R6V75_03320 [Bacteroidales bacterium]
MTKPMLYLPKYCKNYVFIPILFSLVIQSCTERIDIYEAAKPVPIVYCLLNPEDSVQYIRIGRSYMAGYETAEKPPLPDSTVWNIPHEVYIEEYTDGIKETVYRFKPDTVIKKDTGFFPVTGLSLYSTKFRPVSGKAYHLYVFFPDLNLMAAASTIVHQAPDIFDPIHLSLRKITFEPGLPYTIRWYAGFYTGVYQMTFRIHYRDSTAAGIEVNSADYSSGGYFDQHTQQMLEYNMSGKGFYLAMVDNIPMRTGVVRSVISVEFIMVTGGTDLGFLYRTNIENGSNFSNLSDYSNIGNGIGVFSSRILTREINLTLSNYTLDQLAHGEITHSLGFTDSKGN